MIPSAIDLVTVFVMSLFFFHAVEAAFKKFAQGRSKNKIEYLSSHKLKPHPIMTPSRGAIRIGPEFNPSNDPVVAEIKHKAADIFDLIEAVKQKSKAHPDLAREIDHWCSAAQNHLEIASMLVDKININQAPAAP